ncbi:sulfite exporter TauE/SafE family protein [Paenibacillus solisilvae]|uniref:Probable membrane transporter protein n=1 Tax=Paenibacillus solisilvae TaxID=2486751 RepID=A0ABW0VZC3_9BACL
MWSEWMLAFPIVLLAAMIQTSTGFGFAIIAIPLFILLYPTHYAILLSVFLSLISSLTTLPRVVKDIDKLLLKRLLIGSLFGLPLGGLLYYTADVAWLKLIVGFAIILSALSIMIKIRFPLGDGKRIGFLSGFLTSSIGVPGPPIIFYLMSKNMDKNIFRGTSMAYYCVVYPASLAILLSIGRFHTDLLLDLLLIPAIFIGQAFGSVLHKRINQTAFRRLTFILLVATGINSVIQSF